MHGTHLNNFMDFVDGLLDQVAAAKPIPSVVKEGDQEALLEAHEETPRSIAEKKTAVRRTFAEEWRKWRTAVFVGVDVNVGDIKIAEKGTMQANMTCSANELTVANLYALSKRECILCDKNAELFEEEPPVHEAEGSGQTLPPLEEGAQEEQAVEGEDTDPEESGEGQEQTDEGEEEQQQDEGKQEEEISGPEEDRDPGDSAQTTEGEEDPEDED